MTTPNPIDAKLAAFITQAIRDVMAEERRQDLYDRRNTAMDENRRNTAMDENRRNTAMDENRRRSAREDRKYRASTKNWYPHGTQLYAYTNCPYTTSSSRHQSDENTSQHIPFTLNSKPAPGGRRIGGTSVPRDWANNPVSAVPKNISNDARHFTWGFPWSNTEQNSVATANPITTTPTTTTNTKKVSITEPDTAHTCNQSRFEFARPKTTTSTTNTSNSAASSEQPIIDIPNRDNHIKLIFGGDKNMKSNLDTHTNKNTCFQAKPTQWPTQPSYPPPLYPGIPEVVLDTDLSSEYEQVPTVFNGNQQNTTKKDGFSELQKTFDKQVPDAITGILSSLLGVDMKKELENIADELRGIHPSSGICDTAQHTGKQNSAHPAENLGRKLTVSNTQFKEAYQAFAKYCEKELSVCDEVQEIFRQHFAAIIHNRIYNTNSYVFSGHTQCANDTRKRVLKAIITELSISNRIDDLEDMIKNIPIDELTKIKLDRRN